MSEKTNSEAQSTTGADAIDVAIASGIDFDGTPIPKAKLDLYEQVMGDRLDPVMLRDLEWRDTIFQELNYRVYA